MDPSRQSPTGHILYHCVQGHGESDLRSTGCGERIRPAAWLHLPACLEGHVRIGARRAVGGAEARSTCGLCVEDMEQGIDVQSMPTGIQRIFADTNPEIAINGVDDYRVDVDVAVIDTGVDFQHPDLNVVGGVTCSAPFIFWATCNTGGDDDHFHGTHVAGTIGALDNGIGVVGVAPGARIWAVKVLNSSGSGYSSQIVAGIDWVTAHASYHRSRQHEPGRRWLQPGGV